MHPADRRRMSSAASTRLRRAGRGGFTLVEMLISVTLVLLMMLMFAEIYGIAQQTMSTQKGIAENDQKARILSEVMRRDLATRTFRSVYPFRLEPDDFPADPTRNDNGAAFATVNDVTQELIQLRRGYFSISENHPEVDTDDVLQLTVAADQLRYGRPGDRLYGKATQYPIVPPASGPTPIVEDQPEYDDGVLGNVAGAAGEAEVSYFLRNGNLYRSQLLIRHPYLPPDADGNGSITPRDFPTSYPGFANDFDYSAYRDLGAAGTYEPRFHGHNATFDSLNNNTDAQIEAPYLPPAAENLWFPRILSVPNLRFGHIANDSSSPAYAPPFEHAGGVEDFDGVVTGGPRSDFFGRFNTFERADADFEYPGTGFKPFDNATAVTDGDGDGVIDLYSTGARRGVELMLSNVHSFDIEVWDDIIGDFVNLGHELTGPNPYIIDPSTGTNPVQDGFYHRSRLRRPIAAPGAVGPAENFYFDHSSVTSDVGNRYDTWSPRMYIANSTTGEIYRTGRAPYKPQKTNPDPNTGAYNDPTSTTPGREASMAFGNTDINVDLQPPGGDGATLLTGDYKESDGEVPLRAIRITIRYLDIASGQTRQTTIEQSLVD